MNAREEIAAFENEWAYFLDHIDEEDPVVQRWTREDRYAVKQIMRAGWQARSDADRG